MIRSALLWLRRYHAAIQLDAARKPLTQELLNSIMRTPGESRATAAPALPKCPRCEERYCGDGVQLCTECAAPNAQPSPSTARMKTQEAIVALRERLGEGAEP